MIVPIDFVRRHCRVGAANDELLTRYVNAAHKEAESRTDRAIFETGEAMAAAVASLQADLLEAETTYKDAIAAADGLEPSELQDWMINSAGVARRSAYQRAERIRDGIVIDAEIEQAIVMIVDSRFNIRGEVISGQGVAAIEVPHGAASILKRKRKLGQL
jgi:hypothetical protein